MPEQPATAATDCYVRVPDHVCDRHGNVWRVVRDGGMVTRADYDGIESCGITFAESMYGPLRPVYTNGGPRTASLSSRWRPPMAPDPSTTAAPTAPHDADPAGGAQPGKPAGPALTCRRCAL